MFSQGETFIILTHTCTLVINSQLTYGNYLYVVASLSTLNYIIIIIIIISFPTISSNGLLWLLQNRIFPSF
jgi:hypothetical protein